MQHHRMAGTLFVPNDNCKTLKEAVNRVHGDERLSTIVVGKGEHVVEEYTIHHRGKVCHHENDNC